MALTAALGVWDSPRTSYEVQKRSDLLAQALSIAAAYLYPRDISLNPGATTTTSNKRPRRSRYAESSRPSSRAVETPEISGAFAYVLREGRGDEVYQDFIDAVEDRFYLVIQDASYIASRLKDVDLPETIPDHPSEEDEVDAGTLALLGQVMIDLLERLSKWQRTWATPLKALNDPRRISSFTIFFHQLLHSSLPSTFPLHLRYFLTSSLSSLTASSSHPDDPTYSRPTAPSPHFSRLGILPRYSATLNRVAQCEIQKIAFEEAHKGWDVRYLAKAHRRVGEGIAGWLNALFIGNDAAQSALRSMFGRMDYSMCKCFFDIRTDELFDIIVDYPESLAALEDLKDCLVKVDQRQVLVDKLNAANQKRLLHPGAETKDVITQYISTIRCLRILDPPGVLLHKIAEPIRKHLRDRPDTIKCIVAFLVEGEGLQEENESASGGSGGIISQTGEDEAENFSDPKWDPEPVDAAPEFRSGKAGDIVSTLVSIYETREVIIQELQTLLASRLLLVKDYDAVKEIRTIELLKLRFGEAALQGCDVMLKDMADSKRIDDHVHGDIESTTHPLIISRMFWPEVPGSSLRLPPKLLHAAETYESAFHQFKPDKHLRWLQHLGTVQLTISLEDREVEVEATAIQAAIIELFETDVEAEAEADVETEIEGGTGGGLGGVGGGLSLGDVCGKLGLGGKDEGAVIEGLGFWRDHGVLREGLGGKWELVERLE